MILHALFSGIVFLTGSTASPDAFDKSLALVPPDAGAICAIPNLGLLNNDLGALIDGTNQPAAVLAGRPIEMMKALLGFGAGFDESGSMLLWLPSAMPIISASATTAKTAAADRHISTLRRWPRTGL